MKDDTNVHKSKTKIYQKYRGMISRCEDKSRHNYNAYGGKGIKVCPEWRNDFDTFRSWAYENGYSDNCGLSLDRINNNDDYKPENCRWILLEEQNHNKCDTYYTPDGQPLSVYCQENNINANRARKRMKRLWSFEAAVGIDEDMNEQRYITAPDGSANLSGWCKKHGYNYKLIHQRVKRDGWNLIDAINAPKFKNKIDREEYEDSLTDDEWYWF